MAGVWKTACRLKTCRLKTCRLKTCRLKTCRLKTCRLKTRVIEAVWARASGEFAVRQTEKNQAAKNHRDKAEGPLHAVPGVRLPHGKVFAADDNKTEKPQAEPERQS